MPRNTSIVPSNEQRVSSNATEAHVDVGGKKRSERLRARRDEAGLAQVSGWVPKDRRAFAREVLAALSRGSNSLPPDPEQAATLKAAQAALEAAEAEMAAIRITEVAARKALLVAQKHEQGLLTELAAAHAEIEVMRDIERQAEIAKEEGSAAKNREAAAIARATDAEQRRDIAEASAAQAITDAERFQNASGLRGRIVRWLVQ